MIPISRVFHKFELTMDPSISWCFESENNALVLNIWSLFFSTIPEGAVVFRPIEELAGALIHEYEHYLFLNKPCPETFEK